MAKHKDELTAPPVEPIPPAPVAVPIPNVPAFRRARVAVPETHVGSIDVEIPGDLTGAAAVAAAILAAKAARGIVAFGAPPQVEFLD